MHADGVPDRRDVVEWRGEPGCDCHMQCSCQQQRRPRRHHVADLWLCAVRAVPGWSLFLVFFAFDSPLTVAHFLPELQTYPTNTDYSKGVMNSLTTAGNNVPYQVNEYPIQATPLCGAYGAGLPLNDPAILGTVAGTTTTTVQGSQTVAYTLTTTRTTNGVPLNFIRTSASQLYYSTPTCAGAPIGIYTYLSDLTGTVAATGAPATGVQNVAAGSNVNTGIWVASSSYVTGLPASVPYLTQNYYASPAGCTASSSAALTWTQYQFPGFGCVARKRRYLHPSLRFSRPLTLQVQCLHPVRGPQPGGHVRDRGHADGQRGDPLRKPAAVVRRHVRSSVQHQHLRPNQLVHGTR